MATINIYPYNIVSNTAPYSNASTLLGFTEAGATFSNSMVNNEGVYIEPGFKLFDYIPVGSTITQIRVKIRGYTSALNRILYSVNLKADQSYTYTYTKFGGSGIPTVDSTLTMTFDTPEAYIPSIQLLATPCSVDIGIVNVSGSTNTTSIYLKAIWLEVDFTPPAGIYVANIGVGVDYTNNTSWTTPEYGIMQDWSFANKLATNTSAETYYFNNNSSVLPTNAIVTGVLVDVFAKCSFNAFTSIVIMLKLWNMSDYAVYSVAQTDLTMHRFGGPGNPLGVSRINMYGNMSDFDTATAIRFVQQDVQTSTLYIDHVSIVVYYTIPVQANNVLLLGENF